MTSKVSKVKKSHQFAVKCGVFYCGVLIFAGSQKGHFLPFFGLFSENVAFFLVGSLYLPGEKIDPPPPRMRRFFCGVLVFAGPYICRITVSLPTHLVLTYGDVVGKAVGAQVGKTVGENVGDQDGDCVGLWKEQC